jgi:hypothetical protein
MASLNLGDARMAWIVTVIGSMRRV